MSMWPTTRSQKAIDLVTQKQASRAYIMSKKVDYLIYHPQISEKATKARLTPGVSMDQRTA